MFHPEHFPPETWFRHRQEGYKLRRFLPLAPQQIAEMDAEVFLREGLDFFMTSPGINVNEDSCMLARIFAPDGRTVCLRLDRDYFEIYVRDANGSDSAAVWQFEFIFRGYWQDELWSNMVMLLSRHQTLSVKW